MKLLKKLLYSTTLINGVGNERYSAFVPEQEMMVCCLKDQEMRLSL
jgi:hypothetical protein